ncbi:MAG: enoyl-CoA hydratase/isomerase family protein [Rhodoferax sp.]
MTKEVRYSNPTAGVAVVELVHAAKFNAMSRTMWRQLQSVFQKIQDDPQLRCVVVRASGHFCAGGDISEYAAFRFQEESLRAFHEDDVWGGLQAMLDCDVPIVAQICGNCMGAGVEIASCCDVRIAADDARFGAPIAKLGFPMAPREAALVAHAVGELTAREMLLTAAVLDSPAMQRRGFLNHVVPLAELDATVHTLVQRMLALAPQAARMNKRTFRALAPVFAGNNATEIVASAYQYANSSEHREGIQAFLDKRAPRFTP